MSGSRWLESVAVMISYPHTRPGLRLAGWSPTSPLAKWTWTLPGRERFHGRANSREHLGVVPDSSRVAR